MFCTSCGHELPTSAARCPACSALAPAAPGAGASAGTAERELLRFGPFGISISRKRPGVFVAAMKNCTEVVATDKRLFGVRKPGCLAGLFGGGSGRPTFEVPWTEIVAAERADFLLNRAIHFQYRGDGRTLELAVIAAPTCHVVLERLWQLVEQHVTARRA